MLYANKKCWSILLWQLRKRTTKLNSPPIFQLQGDLKFLSFSRLTSYSLRILVNIPNPSTQCRQLRVKQSLSWSMVILISYHGGSPLFIMRFPRRKNTLWQLLNGIVLVYQLQSDIAWKIVQRYQNMDLIKIIRLHVWWTMWQLLALDLHNLHNHAEKCHFTVINLYRRIFLSLHVYYILY